MNSAIEFVDQAPRPEASADGRRRRLRGEFSGWVRRRLGAGVMRNGAIVAWLAAAVLCAVASFQTVFTYRFDGSGFHTRGGFTASGGSLDPILSSEHGPRYAVLFCVCAVWFLTLCLLVATEGAGRGLRALAGRHVAGLAGAGAFLLAGSVASVGLGLEASHSTYSSLSGSLDQAGLIAFQWHTGPCVWWAVAALGTAFAGLLATSCIPAAAPSAIPAAAPSAIPAAAPSAAPAQPPPPPPAPPVSRGEPDASARAGEDPADQAVDPQSPAGETVDEVLVLRRRGRR